MVISISLSDNFGLFFFVLFCLVFVFVFFFLEVKHYVIVDKDAEHKSDTANEN